MNQQWTTAYMRQLFEDVKNWGRWGAEDERGALNLITLEKQREAAASVSVGEVVSCARELPVHPNVENPFPALHMMVNAGDDCVTHGIRGAEGLESTTDFIGIAYHGTASTHIDALCHVFVDGKMYNGFDASEVKSTGARRGSIMAAKEGIVSRGVLLDIPRLLGRKWLEPGKIADMITVEQLEAAEAAQNVRVSAGDILLISTGRDQRRAELGPWSTVEHGFAGLHHECLRWLRKRDIAVLGSDSVSDASPGFEIPHWPLPIHQMTLVAMGVHLIDNMYLENLAQACARHKKWHFQLTIAPLRIERGTGSPVNPVAVL